MTSVSGGSGSWDADLYDTKLSFVSRYGLDLVALLGPKPGERILDLGCGTGDLSSEIAVAGAAVLGVDASAEMIEAARVKYPDLSFTVDDARAFRPDEHFDAVFSNAALHWIKEADEVARTVREVLLPHGRFVAEFGGKGNVLALSSAIEKALARRGIAAEERNRWYFPSVGEYATLLERHGFRVRHAVHFDRPTRLEGEEGLRHWLAAFAGSFFEGMNGEEREEVFCEVEDGLRPHIFRGGGWIADYSRLRLLATRER